VEQRVESEDGALLLALYSKKLINFYIKIKIRFGLIFEDTMQKEGQNRPFSMKLYNSTWVYNFLW